MNKLIFAALISFGISAPINSLLASPLYPWDQYRCASINQGDGLKIGAICARYDHDLQVSVLDIYYFGYLWQKRAKYLSQYVNLSVDGSGFFRRPLVARSFGDGSNLPKVEVLNSTFIISTNFEPGFSRTEGKPFAVYFQAEQTQPTNHPPFEYDNLYGDNYRGALGRVQ